MSRHPDADDAVLASITVADAIDPDADDDAASVKAGYEPIGQAIARRVREAILDGRLSPGTRIRQEALARRFGVSRIPVREALRLLETQGLVTLVPHSGARVARLDLAEHLELYLMREALEPLAIAQSAPHLDDVQLAELHALVDEIAAAHDDEQRWLELDRRFHLKSYAAAPLPRLLGMIEDLWNTTQHYRRAYRDTLSAEEFAFVDLDHRFILDALDRHDPDDAKSRMRSHIRRTRQTLTEHSDVFE